MFAGSDSALRLILNIENYDYMKGPYTESGIKVIIYFDLIQDYISLMWEVLVLYLNSVMYTVVAFLQHISLFNTEWH